MKTRYFKYVYILLIVLILFIVGSYAFFSWGSNANNNTNVSFDVIADTVYIEYDAGSDITGANLYPVDDKSNGISKTITVKTDKVSSKPVTFNLYLDLTSVPTALLHNSFKWAIYTGNDLVSSGNLTDSTVSCNKNSAVNHIVLFSNEKVTTTEKKYVLYLWIDGTGTDNNPDDMMNKSFEFNLHADGSNALLKSATNILTKKYENGNKTSITTAGGEEITQAKDVGLMQDSFGNIRYYGADPNNYVTFNGETAGWRIIGVFDTEDENGNVSKRIKLVRATSIGDYSWDNKNTSTGAEEDYGKNEWTTARLMKLLNPSTVYTTDSNDNGNGQSLYWNRTSGTCFSGKGNATTSCDFTSTGLTDTAKNQIDKVKYYLGGNYTSKVYADDYYNFERGTKVYIGRSTSWNGYIGLMYPSDYAYATDLSVCTNDGYNFNSDTTNCTDTDWLFNSSYIWLISPLSGDSYTAFNVESSGRVYNITLVFASRGVRPVAYLKSSTQIVNGVGTQSDPYILG